MLEKKIGDWLVRVAPTTAGAQNQVTGQTVVTSVIEFPVGPRVGKVWTDTGTRADVAVPEQVQRAAQRLADELLV